MKALRDTLELNAEAVTNATQTVRNMLPKSAKVRRLNSDGTSLGILETHLRRTVDAEYLLYVVEGSLPLSFCISELKPAPVVMSNSYLRVFHTLRTSLNPPLDPSLQRATFYHSILRLVGELTLQEGSPDLAVGVFLRSFKMQHVSLFSPVLFSSFDLSPINEPMIAALFFSFVHEVGHVFYARLLEKQPTLTQELQEYFRDSMISITTNNPACTGAQAQNIDALLGTEGSMLSPPVWAEEIWVDCFVALTLYAVAPQIMKETGAGEFDTYGMAGELLITHQVLGSIEFAMMISSLLRNGAVAKDAMVDKWRAYSIAFQLRDEWMLENIIALHSAKETFEEKRRDDVARGPLWAMSIQLRLRYSLVREMEHIVPEIVAATSQPDAWVRELEDASIDGPEAIYVDRFLEIADYLSIDSEALRALRKKAGSAVSRGEAPQP